MKRIITILFLLVSMALFAQQEHLPKVAWRTMVRDVVLLTDSTYQVTIAPLDINEPGAMTRTIGNYLKDFEGHTFLIIDSTSTTIDVKDILDVGVGPRIDRQGIIYRSIGDGSSPFLAPVYYNHLDQTAKDYSRRIELSILWKEANLYAQDSAQIQFHEDTLTWDATKSDLENYLSIQAFTDSIPTIKLIRLDSTGFRITESQISDLQNYQLDSDTTIWDATKTDVFILVDSLGNIIDNLNIAIDEGFSNAHEADPLFQDWDKMTGINISKKQIIDIDTLELSELTIGEVSVDNFSDDHLFSGNSPTALVTERAIKQFVQNSISGGVTYLGGWNASTNTPTLSDATGSNGDMYSITVTGTRDLGSGSVTWTAGGFAIHNGTKYEFVGYDAVVASVNEFTGTVGLWPILNGDSLFIRGNTTGVDLSNIESIQQNSSDINQNAIEIADLKAVSDAIEIFTANSGQTTFTLSNSPSREYTVSQNGIVLPPSAYTINLNTLSVTGGVWENDRIQINYKY